MINGNITLGQWASAFSQTENWAEQLRVKGLLKGQAVVLG